MVNRAKLRGKPLDEDCKTARTTTNEYGPADNRTFCYGIFDRRTDTPIEKCYGCKAFVENATPLKGQTEKFVAGLLTADDVISESAKSLVDMLAEAQAKALKEDIKANTVIIDEHFAKVNAFDFVFGRDVMHLPPMICGLEVQVSDELPDGYSFAVLEAPETERERLIRQAKSEAAREIFEEIEKSVALKMPAKIVPIFKRDLDYSHGVVDGKRDALFEVLVLLAELKKKYTEDK